MLELKHGAAAVSEADRRNEAVKARTEDYDARASAGELAPIYQFGEGVLSGDDLEITADEILGPGYGPSIPLSRSNPFKDYTDGG